MYRVDSRTPVPAEEPPTRDGWPRPLCWLLGGFSAVAIGFIVATAATAVVIFQQYPAKVSAPDTVLGLPKAQDITDEARPPDGTRIPSGFFQAYADNNGERLVTVTAAHDLYLMPASRLSSMLRRIAGEYAYAGEIVDVPAGDLGGAAACVNVTARQDSKFLLVICGWADHGTVGLATFLGAKDRDEAARWMLDIREAVVKR